VTCVLEFGWIVGDSEKGSARIPCAVLIPSLDGKRACRRCGSPNAQEVGGSYRDAGRPVLPYPAVDRPPLSEWTIQPMVQPNGRSVYRPEPNIQSTAWANESATILASCKAVSTTRGPLAQPVRTVPAVQFPELLWFDNNGNLVAIAAGNAADGSSSVIDFTVPRGGWQVGRGSCWQPECPKSGHELLQL
jgi:hypothetical protein